MIEIKETNEKNGYCNICNCKDEKKYYELRFFNRLNQGMVVGLCENCLNELTNKLFFTLLRKEVK